MRAAFCAGGGAPPTGGPGPARPPRRFALGAAAAAAGGVVVPAIVGQALEVFYVLLVLRVLLSWWPNTPAFLDPAVEVIYMATEPVMGALRGLIPPLNLGGSALDISIIVALIAIRWAKSQLVFA